MQFNSSSKIFLLSSNTKITGDSNQISRARTHLKFDFIYITARKISRFLFIESAFRLLAFRTLLCIDDITFYFNVLVFLFLHFAVSG